MYPCPFRFVFEIIISNNSCRLDSPCRKVKRNWIASKEKECRFQNDAWSSYSTIVFWIGCGSCEPSQLVHYLYQVQRCLHKKHSISTQTKDACLLLQLSFHLCCLMILGFSLFAVFTVMLMQLIVNAVLILTPVILCLAFQAPNPR